MVSPLKIEFLQSHNQLYESLLNRDLPRMKWKIVNLVAFRLKYLPTSLYGVTRFFPFNVFLFAFGIQRRLLCKQHHLPLLFLVILHVQNNEPIMTIVAPKRTDFAMSPWVRIPPSAIIGFRALWHTNVKPLTAPPVPKPVLILVIHTFPGPIPTLVASAPAFSNSRTASGVPTLPAITNVSGKNF